MSLVLKAGAAFIAVPAGAVFALGAVFGTSKPSALPGNQAGTHTGACAVTVDGALSYQLDAAQVDNAGTINGVRAGLGLPAYATVVALATALQESTLYNLPGGDRDSAGLFQQRPSQGWGSFEQVTDPVYAANAFLTRLRDDPDWQTKPLTVAAQDVQGSQYPDAYAQWQDEATVLTRALVPAAGSSPSITITCTDGVTITNTTPGLLPATLPINDQPDPVLAPVAD